MMSNSKQIKAIILTLTVTIFCILSLYCLFQFIGSQSPITENAYKYGCMTSKQILASTTAKYDSTTAYSLSSGSLNFNNTIFLDWIYNQQNSDEVIQQLNTHTWELIAFFAMFLVPFVLTILCVPFLCCYCLCPNGCKMFRMKFSGTQKLAWLTTGVSVVGIASLFIIVFISPSLSDLYEKTTCSANIIMSDVLNGSQSLDKQHSFYGILAINSTLNELSGTQDELMNIIDPVSTGGNVSNHIINTIDSINQQLQFLPSGSALPLIIQYPSPINQINAPNMIESQLPSILGSKQQSDSIIGISIQQSITIKQKVASIASTADKIEEINPTFQTQLDVQLKQLHDLLEQWEDADDSVNDIADTIQRQYLLYSQLGLYGFLGLIGLLYVIVGLSSTLLALRPSRFLRFPLYCGCVSSVFLSFFVLALGMAMSVATWGMHESCEYLGTSFTSKQFFQNNLANLVHAQPSLFTCFGGDGKIQDIDFIIDQNIDSWLSDIHQIQTLLNQFDTQKMILDLQSVFLSLTPTINQYLTSQILDITSSQDIKILSDISSPQSYPQCLDLGFVQDSWIPSVNQIEPQAIPCKVAGISSNFSTCQTLENVQQRAEGCINCMDSSDILGQYSSTEDIANMLNLRYLGCTNFQADLSNIWLNFYQTKKLIITPILERSKQITASFEELTKQLLSVDPIFRTVLSQLQTSFDMILDPETGILNGLNCRPLGDDLILMNDIICTNHLPFVFYYRVLLGIIASTLLVLMCLSTYIGANTYMLSLQPAYLIEQQEIRQIKTETQSIRYFNDYRALQ